MGRVLRLVGIEMLEEAPGKDLAPVPEEAPLLVRERQDPRQPGRQLSTGAPIGTRDATRCQSGRGDRGTPGAVRRQQAEEGRSGEATMPARRGEGAQPAGVTPPPDGRRRHAEEATRFGEAHPIGSRGSANHPETCTNLSEGGELAHASKNRAHQMFRAESRGVAAGLTRSAPKNQLSGSSVRSEE